MTLRAADDPDLMMVPRLDVASSYCARSFSYIAPKYYNELPSFIKGASTVGSFKKRLKTHLFTLAYDQPSGAIAPKYKL